MCQQRVQNTEYTCLLLQQWGKKWTVNNHFYNKVLYFRHDLSPEQFLNLPGEIDYLSLESITELELINR